MLGMAMPIVNISRTVEDSSCMLGVNGPPPNIAPQRTKPKSMSAVVAVSRGPRRNAAHSNGRMTRTPNCARLGISAISGLKITAPKMPVTVKIAADSNSGRISKDPGRSVVHSVDTYADGCADGRGKYGDPYELGDAGRSREGIVARC